MNPIKAIQWATQAQAIVDLVAVPGETDYVVTLNGQPDAKTPAGIPVISVPDFIIACQ